MDEFHPYEGLQLTADAVRTLTIYTAEPGSWSATEEAAPRSD
ncbi:hypothetical protein [Streptomyces griseoluteus]